MRDLHRNGELAVYAAGVISKDFNGEVAIKSAEDEGPIGTAFGMMLGAMVDVLAGLGCGSQHGPWRHDRRIVRCLSRPLGLRYGCCHARQCKHSTAAWKILCCCIG